MNIHNRLLIAATGLFSVILLVIIGLSSCQKEQQREAISPKPMVDYSVSFHAETDTVVLGEVKSLNPTIKPNRFYPAQRFEYDVSDPDVLGISVSSNYNSQISAKAIGESDVSIYLTSTADRKKLSSIKVVVIDKPAAPLIGDVFVNFGLNAAPGWNTFPSSQTGAILSNLIDLNGAETGITLTIIDGFNAVNTAGPLTTTTELNMPPDVSKDSYFGNAFAVYEGKQVRESVVKFTGLDKDKEYDFVFFGSRNAVTDNRETKFTVQGLTTKADSINTSANTSKLANVKGIKPKNDGTLTLLVGPGGNNNNSSGFFYISAMRFSLAN